MLPLLLPLALLLSVVAAPSVTAPVYVWLPLVFMVPPLTAMVEAVSASEVSAVPLPTAPPKVSVPVPEVIVSVWAPSMVPAPAKVSLPLLLPLALLLSVVAAPRVTAPV